MHLLLAALLILSAIPAWDYPCFVDAPAFIDGRYQLEVRNPAVAPAWTYTAAPAVEMVRSTFYDIPVTVVITVSESPLITHTLHTYTTVYTDVVELLGYSPHVVTSTDLALRFASPAPFQIYNCAPAVHPHTFIPLIYRPAIH